MAKWQSITPNDVLQLESPAQGYLCPLDANSYGVEFLKFEVRDYDTGKPVYRVCKQISAPWAPIAHIFKFKASFPTQLYLMTTNMLSCLPQSPTEGPDHIQESPFQSEEDLIRSVRYSFPAEFLNFRTVRTA